MDRYVVVLVCCLMTLGLWAEGRKPAALGGVPEYLGYTQVYDFVEELADMGIISVNSVVKPYDRNQIAAWLMEAQAVDSLLSVRQRKELRFYLNDFALECEGMYDGVVQWSNVGSIVNKELWGETFSLKSTVNSQQSAVKGQQSTVNGQQIDPSVLRTAPLIQGSNSERTYSPSVLGGVPDGGGGNNSQLYSLALLQPAFHYADEWFECKLNPILGMDLTMNGHGMVMHRWYGAEIRTDIMDHVAVWGSIRDHSFSGEYLNDKYYKDVVNLWKPYGAYLSKPQFLNNLPGAYYHPSSYGGDYAEIRAGIKAYAWWGSIGLVKDNIQWGDSYHSSNILSGRAPSFPMIELKLKPSSWFRLDYIHGFLASGVIDSTNYKILNNPINSTTSKVYLTARKYIAANMLTFSPIKKMDLSIGSAVIYSERNMLVAFSLPISFFNSLDYQMNSGAKTDNANSQIFFNFSTRNLKFTHFYASIYIDEFNFSRLKSSNKQHNFYGWKVGGRVSNWPLRNLSFTAEFTRTNVANYQHPYPVLTWASNGYNLGHYLGDNAQEIYLALAYKPIRSLSFELTYVNATKYNEYIYSHQGEATYIYQIPFNEKVWSNDEVKLHAVYEVVNNAYAFVDLGWNNARGYEPASEPAIDEVRLDAEGYLKRYTPAFYWGQNWTVKMGFSFYY